MTKLATILIGGDCGPTHGPDQGFPIESYTEHVAPALRQADFRFVNCMRTYSTRGVKSDHAPQVCQPIEMSTLFTSGLFDAVTMANNPSLDAGPEAMLDTRALFIEHGLQVTGAGRNLDEARQPAIIEKAGVRVGYLGYTSVATAGTDAGKEKAGVVNIRVKTTYEPRGPHQPVRVWTSANPHDLARLTDDIAGLRKKVDVVVLAYHAGAIRLPRIISDYQVEVAHAAIDAGADLVVGHAPHIPKAIEVYKEKVVFYSLGVFAMTKSFAAPAWTNEPAWAQGAVRNFMDLDPQYPLMPYGKDCTLALLAKVYVSQKGVAKVSFLPVKFDNRYRPEVLRSDDPRFQEVVHYMEWASEDMPHAFTIEGDEVVVSAQ
jgi:hypothetical protein